jgi:hypothetical protein
VKFKIIEGYKTEEMKEDFSAHKLILLLMSKVSISLKEGALSQGTVSVLTPRGQSPKRIKI